MGVLSTHPAPAPRTPPAWRGEAVVLAALAIATGLLFASGALDITVARLFYRPQSAEHWPLARHFPWAQLYGAASGITAALIVLALAAFAAGAKAVRRHWRRPALLVLLAVAIGPGLLGNALFKDHWRHPRPRDVIELGGTQHYVPAPLVGRESGASFPCGHCTVGFLYAAGWWLWRGRRPRLAAASLALGLALGTLLGIGRLAAGGHFLSDVAWSALLAFAVLHLLHYHLLPATLFVPRREPSPAVPARRGLHAAAAAHAHRLWATAGILGGLAVLAALFALPHGVALERRVPLAQGPGAPRVLEIVADRANVTVRLTDAAPDVLAIAGELHGFGLPFSRLAARLDTIPGVAPRLVYRIEERGWLTDVDGTATLEVPAAAFGRVSVRVDRGDILVEDSTRTASAAAPGGVQLELHAAHGRARIVRAAAANPDRA